MIQGAAVAADPGLIPAGQLRAVVFGAGGVVDGAPGGAASPSAVALARALRAAGLRTAVTSGARDCAALLAAAGVAGLFDVRVDGLDAARLGLAAAPEPALPLEAARRLGVPAARAALVEDTPAAVQAGRRGGFGLVVGVDRAGQPETLREHGADLVVDHLGRLRIDGDGGRELLDRGFDAIMLRWEGAVADDPAGVGRRVEALCLAGVEVAVLAELPLPELEERLGVRPKGPGRLRLCPAGGGLVVADADAPRPLRPGQDGRPGALGGFLAELGARGIGSGLVLVVGADFGPPADPGADAAPLLHPAARAVVASVGAEPRGAPPGVVVLGGGAGALLALLDRQLERRAAGRCPGVDADPAWTVALEVDQRLERVAETLCTVADGHFGTRGSREEGGPGSEPLTVAAGVFDERPGNPLLLAGPLWTGLRAPVAERDRRLLDLRTGTLRREWSGAGAELRSLRFASQVRPGVVGLRAECAGNALAAGPALRPPSEDTYEQHRDGDQMWAGTSAPGAGIVAAAWQREAGGAARVVERIAAYVADPSAHPDPGEALERLRDARADGFDRLLAEHRAAWAARWADAAVTVEGDPPTELALRLAAFHLLSSAAGGDGHEHAFGARGLSGPVYRGHVFWDADVFVLPVLAALDPAAARAMIEYRIRRLPAARRLAARRGRAGARFPWESAADGDEVTPDWAPDLEGRMIRILTGEMEEHIVADVAWALCRYADWTGDRALVEGAGRPLLVETARYWPSRVRLDDDGLAHIDQVIGPDEYHEGVDDNAFTNVMARWHLRRAAALVERDGPAGAEEAAAWRRLAGALVDGHDPGTGVYRQFAGFDELEPLLVATFAEPPVAADVLLGRERTRRTQVIKQADVLMLHLLVPEEVAPGSLAPNLAFYGPRTAHGSSLSPAVHAGLLARAGEPDRALELFRLACQLDLQDLTGTSAGGLHVATFGGVWQALVHGFLGVRLLDDALGLDPHLPAAWQAVELRLRWHGRRVRLRAGHGAVEVTGDGPLRVTLPGLPAAAVPAAGTRFTWSGTAWEEAP
jgi:trehalose/maltose hydrolase-like predicted phosphorylase